MTRDPSPFATSVFAQSTVRRAAPPPRGLPLVLRVALAVVIVTAVFFGSISLLARDVVQDRFAALERDLVLRNRAVLARVLQREIESLETTVGDWGQWDELHAFALGRNPDFAAAELGSTVTSRLRVDLAIFLDPRGGVIHATLVPDLTAPGRDPTARIVAALRRAGGAASAGSANGGHASREPGQTLAGGGAGTASRAMALSPITVAGLLDSPAGPLVLATQPITRTDGSGGNTGTLVLGRRLDAARLSGELSVLPSRVFLRGSESSPADSAAHQLARELVSDSTGAQLTTHDDELSDVTLFRDLNGAPAFLLETRMDRTVWAAGTETTRLLMTLASVGTLVALVTLILVFRQIVTTPLQHLTRYLLSLQAMTADAHGRRPPVPCGEQSDEIGTLAREFGALLDARDSDALSLTRLAAAVEYAADAIAILDRYGRIAYVNSRYQEYTGYRPEEVVGRSPGRAGADRRRFEELWQTVQTGAVWSGLLETVQRDGRIAIEEVTVAPVRGPDGEITSYVAVIRDVTARRAAESELRKLATIAEHATESIAVLDAAGAIEYVNPAFERRRGTSLAAIRGHRPGDTDEGLDDPAMYAAIWATVGAGEVWSGRLHVRIRNGGELLVEDAVMSPVKDASGQVANIVVIMHDVTRRVALETELAQARKLEAVGRLASGVAHEINTPVHYIGENVHFLTHSFACLGKLLQELGRLGHDGGPVPAGVLRKLLADAEADYLLAEVPQALRQSLDGLDRVAEIVRSMKDLAHPADELVVADINPIVRSAVAMAAGQYRSVADVELALASDLPRVPCVPGGLNQVLINMLVNAADAVAEAHRTSGRRGRIRVTTRRSAELVEISVADDGIGMRPEVLERAFDPFFTTKPVGQGTGQGLAIAHSFIKRLGGEIRVSSEPGRGTEFTIRLPVLGATPTAGSETVAGDAGVTREESARDA